ncbi:MAG: MFS transporter [Porticoccaceae bacterium]|nr:MFS transporter [Porticoccaceae bacterium]
MPSLSKSERENQKTSPNNSNIFDSSTAIFAAIVLGFAGTGVAMGMPLLVGSMASSLGFSDQQLGYLASSDMAGLFVGSVSASLVVAKFNRRWLAAAGLFLVILGNYLSIQTPDFLPLMLSRFCAGIGAGLCYGTCTASLAGSHNSARTFSILLFILVIMNAFIFYIFPLIDAQWGVTGLYVFFLLEAIPILLILPLLPQYCIEETDEGTLNTEAESSVIHPHIPEILPRLCLAAVFSFYLLVGAYWAFIERAGVTANISTGFISSTLTWAQIFSLSGTILAVWLARRFGQSKPLLFALMFMVVTMLILSLRIDNVTFVFSVFSFSFFWIFIDVFQLGTLSNIDHSGRYAALVPAFQGAAQALAPAAAGMLLSFQLGYSSVMLMCAVTAAVALYIYHYVYRGLLQVAPDIADAD